MCKKTEEHREKDGSQGMCEVNLYMSEPKHSPTAHAHCVTSSNAYRLGGFRKRVWFLFTFYFLQATRRDVDPINPSTTSSFMYVDDEMYSVIIYNAA